MEVAESFAPICVAGSIRAQYGLEAYLQQTSFRNGNYLRSVNMV